MKNIYVIDYYKIGGTSICLMAQLLGLLLSIPVYKKIGALKTITISLCCMLILGASIPFMALTKYSFSLLLCALSFFSACDFAPILTILHQYYTSSKSLTFCWFAIGATISTLIFSIIPHFTNSLGFSFGGMVVFIVCVLLSLIGANAIYLQKITKINTKLAA